MADEIFKLERAPVRSSARGPGPNRKPTESNAAVRRYCGATSTLLAREFCGEQAKGRLGNNNS